MDTWMEPFRRLWPLWVILLVGLIVLSQLGNQMIQARMTMAGQYELVATTNPWFAWRINKTTGQVSVCKKRGPVNFACKPVAEEGILGGKKPAKAPVNPSG